MAAVGVGDMLDKNSICLIHHIICNNRGCSLIMQSNIVSRGGKKKDKINGAAVHVGRCLTNRVCSLLFFVTNCFFIGEWDV